MKIFNPLGSDSNARRIALVCLGVNLLLLTVIAVEHPAYLRDYTLSPNPDAIHFVLLGRNVFEQGEYSRCDAPPYVPDVMRPPGYPISTGIAYWLAGIFGVYLFNIFCHVATAVGVYWLGRPILGARASTLAGYLVAVHLVLAVSNFMAMSEPLFTLLATVGVLLWLRRVVVGEPGNWLGLAGIGVVLGLATLTRPTSVYMPIVIVIAAAVISLWTRRPRAIVQTAVIAAISVLVVVPWIIRNQVVFGIAHVTHTSVFNLVYYSGASAHAIHHGISLEEAQEALRQEFNLASLRDTNNHWNADRPVRQMYLEQKQAARIIIPRYPLALLKSSVMGVFKASIGHNVEVMADICDLDWSGPGLGQVLSGDVSRLTDMAKTNSLILVTMFFWEMLLSVGILLLGLMGIVRGLWSRYSRVAVVGLCFVIAYYWITVAVIGSDAYCRHGAMVIPIWCLLAGRAVFAARDDRERDDQIDSPQQAPHFSTKAGRQPSILRSNKVRR